MFTFFSGGGQAFQDLLSEGGLLTGGFESVARFFPSLPSSLT